jgi:glutamine synthetase
VDEVRARAEAMREARKAANLIGNDYERALAYHEIAESFPALRRPIDKLEEVVDNKMWPLPKYRELLFIN